jgi:hypothetical protein
MAPIFIEVPPSGATALGNEGATLAAAGATEAPVGATSGAAALVGG